MRTCEAPDCFNPVRHGALCETHAKRLQRGSSLTAPVQAKNRSPRQAFLDAVHRYADADADDERVTELLAQGHSISNACRLAGVNRRTWYRHKEKHHD